MKKHLLILAAAFMMAVCVQARVITPTENQVWWGSLMKVTLRKATIPSVQGRL